MSISHQQAAPADLDVSATMWLEVVERVMAGMAAAPRGHDVQALAEGVAEGFGAAWVRIWLYDTADDALHLRASAGFTDAPEGARTRVPALDPRSPVIAAILRRETVVLDDITGDSGVLWADWLIGRGVRSYAGFPLVVGGRLVGAMAVLGRTSWSLPVLAALRVLARQAALQLDHGQLLGTAARQIERLTTLSSIVRQLLAAGELENLMRVVAEAGARLCCVSGAMVSLLSPDGRSLRAAASVGPMQQMFKLHQEGRPLDEQFLAETATGRALSTKRLVVVEDYAAWSTPGEIRERTLGAGVGSFVVAPLLAGGEAIGVLWVGDAEPRSYAPEDVTMVEALADQAALAIEHARLFARERAEARRTAALADIALSVAVAGSLERVLNDLAQRVVASTAAHACAVFVTEAEVTEARLIGMHGLPEQYARELETAMREGKLTFTLADLDERRPLVRHNVWQTYLARPPIAHLLRFAPMVRWDMTVIVPLATRGRKHGFMAGYFHHDQEPNEEELAFLSAVGNQAAIAVENARLFADAQEKASLEERARLARDLHDSATQTVFSMGMLAQAARLQHERGSDRLGETLDRVAALSQQAHAELRALLLELRPDDVVEQGLDQALARLVSAIRVRSGIGVEITGSLTRAVATEQAMVVFRIVQEALNNAVKHARATRVSVALADCPDGPQVSVADDGVGFDAEAVAARRQAGMGMRSMRERATSAGLLLDIASVSGEGTTVRVVFPPGE
jgi:signal transduction histidine kinase